MTSAGVDWCYALECLMIQKHEGSAFSCLMAPDNAGPDAYSQQ